MDFQVMSILSSLIIFAKFEKNLTQDHGVKICFKFFFSSLISVDSSCKTEQNSACLSCSEEMITNRASGNYIGPYVRLIEENV